ncbi:hypothetical protein evm_007689 [Chilo suppressalis]|nr:hypothetical protein evm_007689 [Chilo suppressalis]
MRGAVKVKLVPYGKSTHDKVDDKWQFICHHGPDECYGNKVHYSNICRMGERDIAVGHVVFLDPPSWLFNDISRK